MEDTLIKRFEKIHPTLHVISTINASKKVNDIITIHCDVCNQEFTKKRTSIVGKRAELGCPICTNKKVSKGYNDIATTAPWMIEYLKNKEDAYKYTWGSHKKVITKCPVCGFEKETTIKNLYYQGFKCRKCDTGISFPNRVARSLLEELQIDYIPEYSPQWCGKYAYDFYFKYNDKEYIVEMDGGLGHGNSDYKHKKDTVGIQRDRIKDKLALEHNLNVIRIDCKRSELKYIKKNILSSELSDIFDLSKIDWNEILRKSTDNLFIQICNYYNQGHLSDKDICNHFHIGVSTLAKALNTCNELGLCTYNKKIRRKHAGKLNSLTQQKRDGIAVDLYDLDGSYIGYFNNATSCARKIIELHPDLGLTRSGIISAIYKHIAYYKGFTIIRKDDKQQSLQKESNINE